MNRRTPLRIAGLVALFALGAAGGVAVGLPGMVERAGTQALWRVQERLGITIQAETVEWSFDGTVTATGLVVRARAAAAGDPPLLAADIVTVDSEVRLLARRVRLERIALEGAVIHVLRDADGRLVAQSVLDAARRLFGGGDGAGAGGEGGGLGYLERALPQLEMTGARVVIDRPPVALPAGLQIPRRTLWSGGSLTARPSDDGARLDVAGRFAETSLDTDNGVAFRVGLDVVAGSVLAPEITFDRAVRFYLGDRVVGVRGVGWTPEEGVLTDLQLSVPLTPDRKQATVGAAATIERIAFGPEPLALLTRALAADGGVSPGAVWRALDWVVVTRPVVMAALDDDGRHSFEDIIGPVRVGGLPGASIQLGPPTAVSLVTDAALAATARLVSGDVGRRPKRALREVVGAAFVAAEARADGVLGGLIDALARLDGPRVEIRDGQVTARLGAETVSLAELTAMVRREDDTVVIESGFTLPATSERRSTLRVTANPRDRQLAVRVEIAALPLRVAPGLLPSMFSAGPDAVLHDTTLSLHWRDKGKVLSASGTISATGIAVDHPDLAASPLTGLSGSVTFDVVLDGGAGRFTLSDGRLETGGLEVRANAAVADYRYAPKLSLALLLPETPVQTVIDAIPVGLRPKLAGLSATGTLRWPVQIQLDTVDVAGMTIESEPELLAFSVRSMGDALDLDQLQSVITYEILRDDGSAGRRSTGPRAGNWVPLEDISPFMVQAVTTTEDAFYTHDGISTFAIRESIVTNLEQMRFARGASTITQQLVKNLFLGGKKTVARKLQELFIASQTEQLLSKEEIMAWYLNVIELGPGIYGVGDASWHYFGKHARDLTALEAIFLASIIPSPRRYHRFFVEGAVSPGWRNYLRVLLGVMVERGKLEQAEADAAFPYDPIFRGSARATSDELAPFPEVYRVTPTVDEPDDDAPDPGMPWGLPLPEDPDDD